MATTTTNPVGTFDAVYTVPLRLEALDMSQGFFAELVGSNKVEFSRLMNGAKVMSNSQTTKFYDTLDALDELVKFFDTVPLGWNDPETIRDLLKNFGLLPEEVKQNVKQSLEVLRGGLAALKE